MLIEIIREAWVALRRNYTRSFLTMLGIVWGIATVTLLIAYGNSFRDILVGGFNAFGKSVVICWPQQTSEQPGGQRAGKKVVLEKADVDMVKANAPLVKYACLNMGRCATKSHPKGAGLMPAMNWSAVGCVSWAGACASNCSAVVLRSGRR